MLSTNKQTDRQTNATKNTTSFCKGGNKSIGSASVYLRANAYSYSRPVGYVQAPIEVR